MGAYPKIKALPFPEELKKYANPNAKEIGESLKRWNEKECEEMVKWENDNGKGIA